MQHGEWTLQTADGIAMFYQEWRPDTRPRAVVSLVHGLGEHSGRYAHVAAHLNGAGYTLLSFDLRGHGLSGGPRGHYASYDVVIDDIDRLLAEAATRAPSIPSFLYGHSLGGNLVLNYALRRRPHIAGIIATSPGLRPAIPVPAWKATIGRWLYDLRPTFAMSNGLDITGLSRDPAVIDLYRADPLVHDRVSARFGLDILQSGEWALDQAAEFPLPLLLVHGSADRVTCHKASREFAGTAGDCCTFVLLDGCYHETHNEPASHRVLDTIVEWLDARMAELNL
jgi:alpha-beta hydrolase superfamily lysophospholipase